MADAAAHRPAADRAGDHRRSPPLRDALDRRVRHHVLHHRASADSAALHLYADQVRRDARGERDRHGDPHRDAHRFRRRLDPSVRDAPAAPPGRIVTAAGLLGPRPAPDEPIRIGFQVWSMGIAWADLMSAGERVEAMGFSSLFANDHFMPVLGDASGPVVGDAGDVFEGWMVLAAWASRTARVPLGMMVSAVGYRNIGMTVKMATALDHASNGRAILGIGAGWHEPEIDAFGYDALTLGERIS